jgi:hypothetical protein
MIHSEIMSSKDVPDEYHQIMNDLLLDMFDALHVLSANPKYGDGRLFLSVLSLVHAEFLAVLMHTIKEDFDPEKYVNNELLVFVKNLELICKRYAEK